VFGTALRSAAYRNSQSLESLGRCRSADFSSLIETCMSWCDARSEQATGRSRKAVSQGRPAEPAERRGAGACYEVPNAHRAVPTDSSRADLWAFGCLRLAALRAAGSGIRHQASTLALPLTTGKYGTIGGLPVAVAGGTLARARQCRARTSPECSRPVISARGRKREHVSASDSWSVYAL
jgi:hypothetical protein